MSVGFSVSFPNGDRYEYITPHITLTNAKESNTNLFQFLDTVLVLFQILMFVFTPTTSMKVDMLELVLFISVQIPCLISLATQNCAIYRALLILRGISG